MRFRCGAHRPPTAGCVSALFFEKLGRRLFQSFGKKREKLASSSVLVRELGAGMGRPAGIARVALLALLACLTTHRADALPILRAPRPAVDPKEAAAAHFGVPPRSVRRRARARLGGRLADGRAGDAADAHAGRPGVPPCRLRGAGGSLPSRLLQVVARQVPRRVRHRARPASVRGPLRARRGGAARGPGPRRRGVRGRVRDRRGLSGQQLGGRGDGAHQAATRREAARERRRRRRRARIAVSPRGYRCQRYPTRARGERAVRLRVAAIAARARALRRRYRPREPSAARGWPWRTRRAATARL